MGELVLGWNKSISMEIVREDDGEIACNSFCVYLFNYGLDTSICAYVNYHEQGETDQTADQRRLITGSIEQLGQKLCRFDGTKKNKPWCNRREKLPENGQVEFFELISPD